MGGGDNAESGLLIQQASIRTHVKGARLVIGIIFLIVLAVWACI